MKIAICFAGLPRFSSDILNAWNRKLVEPYHMHVFVHAWNLPNFGSTEIKHSLYQVIKPRVVQTENFKELDTSIYTDDRIWPHRSSPNNVLSMWHSINRSFDLAFNYAANHNFKWDIMVRARWDWHFDNIDLKVANAITVPNDPGLNRHLFEYRGTQYCAHNDQFGYGPHHLMYHYADTINQIPNLYLNERIDFCSELLLTANLIQQNININYDDINFKFGV